MVALPGFAKVGFLSWVFGRGMSAPSYRGPDHELENEATGRHCCYPLVWLLLDSQGFAGYLVAVNLD